MSYYGPSSPNPGRPDPHQSGSFGWNPQGGPPQNPQPPHPGGMPYMPVAQPGTLPLRPQTLGDYFSSLFATLRKSPGLFFGAALIFGGLAAILTATGEFIFSRSITNINPLEPYEQLGSVFGGLTVWFLVSVFLSQIADGVGRVLTWGMYSTMVGRGAIGIKTSLGQGFRLLRGQWWRLIGLTLLIIAGGVVLVLAFVLLMFLTGVLVSASVDAVDGAFALILLGGIAAFVLPMVPALFFITRWCLVVPAMIVEDLGVFAALRRSWNLTRGNFWRTFGIGVLFTVIVAIVASVIMTPLTIFSTFALVGTGTEFEFNTATVILSALISAVSTLVSFVIMNMLALVANSLYYDYRFRQEGLHLEFQQLAAQHASAATIDRFDTSPDEQRPSTVDETNDVLPGRHSVGAQQGPASYPQPGPYPGPYGQQPPQPPQGPPQPPGTYR